MIHHLGNGSICSRLWSNLMPCVGLMGGFNVHCNKPHGLKTSNYFRRDSEEGKKIMAWRIKMLSMLQCWFGLTAKRVRMYAPAPTPIPITLLTLQRNRSRLMWHWRWIINLCTILLISYHKVGGEGWGGLTWAESSQRAAFPPSRPWLGSDNWRRRMKHIWVCAQGQVCAFKSITLTQKKKWMGYKLKHSHSLLKRICTNTEGYTIKVLPLTNEPAVHFPFQK